MISVLIVEDEPLIAEAHRAYLGRLTGFSVTAVTHTARDAMRAAAEALASETPIDLVLLDIGLPDANGIALASGLSGLRPAPDIIAITSERDLEMVRAAVGHGALAYLLKPFTFAAFRDRLQRYQRYREALPAGTDAASQAEVDRLQEQVNQQKLLLARQTREVNLLKTDAVYLETLARDRLDLMKEGETIFRLEQPAR